MHDKDVKVVLWPNYPAKVANALNEYDDWEPLQEYLQHLRTEATSFDCFQKLVPHPWLNQTVSLWTVLTAGCVYSCLPAEAETICQAVAQIALKTGWQPSAQILVESVPAPIDTLA